MKKNSGNKPKILIIGTGNLLNYGCEAIVQGTYNMLSQHWSEYELTVASDDPAHDQKNFAGYANIKFVHYRKRFTLYRLLMGILRRAGIGKGSPVRMNAKIVDYYDIILSAGGDNYAEAPDGGLYHILQDLIKIGDRASRKGKMFILWGASVGPFSSENRKLIKKNLEKADLIFPREQISYNYLIDMGLSSSKTHLIADPAFCMPTMAEKPLSKPTRQKIIGLNISQLAINHIFKDGRAGKEIVFKALDNVLQQNEDFRFLCIPHVLVGQNGPQNDIAFMKEYIKFSGFKDRISMTKTNLNARKTKAVISGCDLLIAARMHCCIAGISTATPTLFFTYSHKGTGVAEYVYGDTKYCLKLNQFNTEQLCNKVHEMIDNNKIIRNHLEAQKPRFVKDATRAILTLKERYANRTGT